jgi:LmbE family N-acetylglucosaminyl deacetylase
MQQGADVVTKLEDLCERVLVLGAHPDDEIIGCGGTIARLAAAGKEIVVVTFTYGGTSGASSTDQEAVAARRKQEATAADRILGISRRIGFDILPQAVANDRATHQRLIGVIRNVRPQIILTHSPDMHRDHKAICDLVPGAAYQASEEILVDELGPPWLAPWVWQYEILKPFWEPTVAVDVTGHLEKKVEALRTQLSQTRSGYLEEMERMVRASAAYRGAQCHVAAAEAFKTLDTYATLL